MRFSNLTFLLVAAGATFGLATPTEAANINTEVSARSDPTDCEHGWDACGVCAIYFINH
jgi:hypothetical protein